MDTTNSELDLTLYKYLIEYKKLENETEKKRYKTIIVKQMMPIVNRIAKTIARRAYDPIEDLIQAGFIGVLKAIDYYKPDINDNFRIYAGYLVIGEIRHYLRDKTSAIRVPAHMQELVKRINTFIGTLTAEDLENLTNIDVAKALQVSPQKVELAQIAEKRQYTVSLEELYGSNHEYRNYEDKIADGDYQQQEFYADAKIILNELIKQLPIQQRLLIDMFYNQGLSKQEIANKIGCTAMTAGRDIRNVLNILCEGYKDKTSIKDIT